MPKTPCSARLRLRDESHKPIGLSPRFFYLSLLVISSAGRFLLPCIYPLYVQKPDVDPG